MAEKDLEKAWTPLLDDKSQEGSKPTRKVWIWVFINVLSTIAIVYVNKSLFADPSFKRCPSSFVAYHFAITGIVLYTLSHPRISLFTPAPASILSLLPLAAIMCANVVVVNLSLAFSSIICYQIVRILLTPLTAGINYVFYGSRIPLLALLAIIPACFGVGMVSYYDSVPTTAKAIMKSPSATGAIFAFSGLFTSALYTVWVAQYHKRLQMSSMQLLMNQVPLGTLLLIIASLFTDTIPNWRHIQTNQWLMLLLSGFLSTLVNTSQFFIIDSAGAVSSTVVGHLKTCLIVALGWVVAQKSVGSESVMGISLALVGIVLYSYVMYRDQNRPVHMQ